MESKTDLCKVETLCLICFFNADLSCVFSLLLLLKSYFLLITHIYFFFLFHNKTQIASCVKPFTSEGTFLAPSIQLVSKFL